MATDAERRWQDAVDALHRAKREVRRLENEEARAYLDVCLEREQENLNQHLQGNSNAAHRRLQEKLER